MGHRARVSSSGGTTTVKAIISHPMETGLRKNKKTGKKYPAHYITELKVTHGGKTVLTANLGPAVSRSPLLHFTFKGGKKGDKVVISWIDNLKKKDKIVTKIK